jgi:hypothetical protein
MLGGVSRQDVSGNKTVTATYAIKNLLMIFMIEIAT